MSKKAILKGFMASVLTIISAESICAADIQPQFSHQFLKDLKTKDANIDQLKEIYKQLANEPVVKQINSDDKAVTSYLSEMKTNDKLITNIKMLEGDENSRIAFLDQIYKLYAPELVYSKLTQGEKDAVFSQKKNLKEESCIKAEELFINAYNALKAGEEVADQDGKYPFPQLVSKWGNYKIAAEDRVTLELLIKDARFCAKAIELVKKSYLYDASKDNGSGIPNNPNKETVYDFIDGKTANIAAEYPNNIAAILADLLTPGGGMLKGTGAQEESTLRARRMTQIALYMIASTDTYPLQQQQALTIDQFVLSAMPNNDTTSSSYNSPESAIDFVKTIKLVAESTIRSAILQAQNLDSSVPKVLILGAAGCGAFKCPPELVAMVFRDILMKYDGYFDNVKFVILGANSRYNVDKTPESGLFFQPFMNIVADLQLAKLSKSN